MFKRFCLNLHPKVNPSDSAASLMRRKQRKKAPVSGVFLCLCAEVNDDAFQHLISAISCLHCIVGIADVDERLFQLFIVERLCRVGYFLCNKWMQADGFCDFFVLFAFCPENACLPELAHMAVEQRQDGSEVCPVFQLPMQYDERLFCVFRTDRIRDSKE